MRDYRLCFFLNQKLQFSFARKPDLLVPGAPDRSYSFFLYQDHDERRNYFLIANHHPEGKLLPGQKGLDFLLFIDEILRPSNIKELTAKLHSVPHVLGAFALDPSKIKNIGALLEEIEMHVITF